MATMLPHPEKISGLDDQQKFLEFSFSAASSALPIALLHAIVLGSLTPAKCLIGPIPEKIA